MSGTMKSRRTGLWRLPLAVVAAAVLVVTRPAAAAPKTDVVYLANGDRLTCEIKTLEQGSLTISTDPADRVVVHWGTVAGVISSREFAVTVISGDRYYGSLGRSPASGELTVTKAGTPPVTLRLSDVSGLVPIGASLWTRMDGSVDVGFTFSQANLEAHWTFNGAASYRSRKYFVSSSLASQLTAREDEAKTSRNTLSSLVNRNFDSLWFATLLAQVQQNDELDLALRTVGGGGVGKVLSQSNRRSIGAFAGVVYTRERFTDDPAAAFAELAVGGQLGFFTPASNDFMLTNSIVSYYSGSRVRVEAQSAWRHEFLGDFYWTLNGVESFDSNPPADRKRNDYSVSLAIGWKF